MVNLFFNAWFERGKRKLSNSNDREKIIVDIDFDY
jgi:hypothetical protein